MAIKKSELYSSLWSSCDELRGGMDASQYKDYVLVMLFIKYVSDKYAGQSYVDLYKSENEYKDTKFTVTPLLNNEKVQWVEAAGYSLGESQKPNNFPIFFDEYLFELDVNQQRVIDRPYL